MTKIKLILFRRKSYGKKLSKYFNKKLSRRYCNFYWGKYAQSNMMNEVSFENYLTMCHF